MGGYLGQVDLMDTDPDKKHPAVQALALTFANATQKEVAARFEIMAKEVEQQNKGQGLLLARPENKPASAFIKAFLQPIVYVDGQTITGFNPRGNELHAALQWAYDHGGKGKTASAALEHLQKIIGAKKTTEEEKTDAWEMVRLLSEFSSAISICGLSWGIIFVTAREIRFSRPYALQKQVLPRYAANIKVLPHG